jgi:hypothetical protein
MLLLASLALGYLAVASFGDPSAETAGRLWSVLATCVAGLLCSASVLALRILIRRDPARLSAATVLFGVAIVGFVALIPTGFAMLGEVEEAGKDYTGLGAVGCIVLGIALPAVIGLVTVGGAACLLIMRRQIDGCAPLAQSEGTPSR